MICAQSFAQAAPKVFSVAVIIGAALCCLSHRTWATSYPGVSILFPQGTSGQPGLCLQMAAAQLVQSHLFRQNLISP
jgi:hypothetical protein